MIQHFPDLWVNIVHIDSESLAAFGHILGGFLLVCKDLRVLSGGEVAL